MEVTFGNKKYLKTKFSELSGKTVVVHTEVAEKPACKVTSRGDGMTVEFNRSVQTIEEAQALLAELRDMLTAGWNERLKLKPNLTGSLSGH